MDASLIRKLTNIGLSNKEARIYLALLQLGKASVESVARHAELKRPTTYVLLEEMTEKGLVHLIPKTKKKLFQASDPKGLLFIAQETLRQTKSLLPQLQAMQRTTGAPVQTLYFEGLRGVAEALNYEIDNMANTELVGFYATTLNASGALLDVFASWQQRLREQDIRIRGIAPKHKSLQSTRTQDAAFGRTIRQVPYSEYSANISIDAGDDFLRIVAFRDLQAVVINNPEVAQTFHQIFEMVWRSRSEFANTADT